MFNDDVIQSEDSYTHFKATIEELRKLALKFKMPIVSATQDTRTRVSNYDLVGLGLVSRRLDTTDLMLALVSNEELEKDGQLVIKRLKKRI